MPLVLYGPIVVVLGVVGVGAGLWTTLGAVASGYLVWTLAEYWLHRLAFHFVPPGRLGARLHWMVHGIHHDHPNDAKRLVAPPLLSLPAAVGVIWASCQLVGVARGCAAAAGFTVGYLIYDMLHWHLHHNRPTTAVGRELRRRHLLHHFHDDRTGFGVSCPYWDHVFGTAPQPRIRPGS
ncbi:sterol desaturase family protein [Streptomyces hundungensis]|uniref:sterol desaturase family protein n=1 Tax=Streptomyces hundungensis TaxID=1077946 RepID=UPI0033D20D1D